MSKFCIPPKWSVTVLTRHRSSYGEFNMKQCFEFRATDKDSAAKLAADYSRRIGQEPDVSTIKVSQIEKLEK